MNQIVCLYHPRYRGINAPKLSCKTCCKIYVDRVKNHQAQLKKRRGEDAYGSTDEKTAKDKKSSMASGISFHPGTI